MGETNEECEERVEERSNTQAHDTWMMWRAQTLEPMSCDRLLQVRANTRKRWRVRCSVHTTTTCAFLSGAIELPSVSPAGFLRLLLNCGTLAFLSIDPWVCHENVVRDTDWLFPAASGSPQWPSCRAFRRPNLLSWEVLPILSFHPQLRFQWNDSPNRTNPIPSKADQTCLLPHPSNSEVRKNKRCAPLSYSTNMSADSYNSQETKETRAATSVTTRFVLTSCPRLSLLQRPITIRVFQRKVNFSTVRNRRPPNTLRWLPTLWEPASSSCAFVGHNQSFCHRLRFPAADIQPD